MDSNSDMEYTLKDVESVISALDELPFVEKMGYLALATILAVFSDYPAKHVGDQPQQSETEKRSFEPRRDGFEQF